MIAVLFNLAVTFFQLWYGGRGLYLMATGAVAPGAILLAVALAAGAAKYRAPPTD